jgi:hypothetical protein
MVTTLDSGRRKARKKYVCGFCLAAISPGDFYAYQVNIYDGRIYTWRDCLPCDRDNVVTYVHDWTGGWHNEGVDYEQAIEWAEEAVGWPRDWLVYGRPIHPAERLAARDLLARTTAAYDLRRST